MHSNSMTRHIYLVRHGLPQFPGEGSWCLGTADFGLSPLGRLQACQLGEALKGKKLNVFTSPLGRAYGTALFLADAPVVMDGLREMHAGDWDGLCFDEIKKRWPELYEARKGNMFLPIPNSEDWKTVQERFVSAVDRALESCDGDIVIVAHTTVILSFICRVMGDEKYREFKWRQGYGSYYLVTAGEDSVKCEFPWKRPVPELSAELCEKLLEAVKLPEHIKAHSRAVAKEVLRICDYLEKAGVHLDRENIYHAAMLHDIARLESNHTETGAKWLSELGYESIAQIISQHHDLESDGINETAVLYIADKLVQEDRLVTLSTRFEKSREKCRDAEALAAHDRRMKQAFLMRDKINSLCRADVIL